ncbi:collagen-binding protein [Puia dinghuensis]|uniref:Collagen-binding protein n=1 Tax=Puia dinghuensis TaxID=1792502 RepID=A0A8J2XTM7_9BACT|nr:collagen-binding protein [Puia dinghuensis]
MTDSTGRFHIPWNNVPDTLIISCAGYSTVSIPVSPQDTGELTVELPEKQAEEVVVMARYNRGLFWWKKIVQHKQVNNPYKYHSFSSDVYRKLELDLNNVTREGLAKVKLMKPFGFIANDIDSVSGDKPFLPVFMKESSGKCYYSAHPRKRREEIAAVRTSGLKNEGVLHFIGGIEQSINVYENYITLFGKEFISPLSSSGDAHYNYRGADTQYIDGQRYLHLFFSPKRPGENTFSGNCWIHQATWAVSSIDLDISSTADINFVHRFTIRQEFVRQPDNTWIFSRDQFVVEISPLKKEKLSLIARQTILYRQVQIDRPEIAAILDKNTQPEQIVVAADAKIRPDAWWDLYRPEPLSVNEGKVYKLSDTLQSIPLFQSYVHTAEFLIDGRKPLGTVEIGPWYKWISGNQREKLRLRFDLATTQKFSKQLWLHGYLAYGAGDNQFKGQLETRYKLPGNGGYSVEASYLHDLDNGRARNDEEGVSTDNLFSQLIRRPGIRQKFIMVTQERTGVTKEWGKAFSAQLLLSRSTYTTFNPLPPIKMIASNEKDIINTELGLRLRYTPFELGYAVGIPGMAGGDYRYQKLNAIITQNVHLPGWGHISYQVYGGRIWGDPLPFMLLEVHPGNETYYYSKQAFNLMSRYEYVSDRYAGFSVEHNFDKKLLNLLPLVRRLKVRQFWNVKAVWGDLSAADKKLNRWEYGNYRMKSLNGRPYIELGTGLDNIFKYFRLDCVWRFAPVRPVYMGTWLPVRPNLPGNFGVFGSFHIQF